MLVLLCKSLSTDDFMMSKKRQLEIHISCCSRSCVYDRYPVVKEIPVLSSAFFFTNYDVFLKSFLASDIYLWYLVESITHTTSLNHDQSTLMLNNLGRGSFHEIQTFFLWSYICSCRHNVLSQHHHLTGLVLDVHLLQYFIETSNVGVPENFA